MIKWDSTSHFSLMLREYCFNPQWLRWLLVATWLAVVLPAKASPFLGLHPDAQHQPTLWGKSLHTLHLHNGQLYIGYGDYSANTGPIAIRSYNRSTGRFSLPRLNARTEAISQWRSINGQIFGLLTDANFGPSQGGYISGARYVWGKRTEGWSETLVGPAIHSYDIASYNNALFLAGAGSPTASGYAGLFKSPDGGTTWNLDFELPPPVGGYGRFYGLHGLGESLYAFATQVAADATATLVVYQNHGGAWSSQPILSQATEQGSVMTDLVSLAGVIIGRNNHAGLALGRMHAFDGSTLREVIPRNRKGEPVATYDHTVANGALYALTSDFRITKTTDLMNWTDVVTGVTSNARSLAVVDDCEVYVGGANAGLYRYGSAACRFQPSAFRDG